MANKKLDVLNIFFDKYFNGDTMLTFIMCICIAVTGASFVILCLILLTESSIREDWYIFPVFIPMVILGPFIPSIIARIVYNMKYGCILEKWDMHIQDKYFTIKLVNFIAVFVIIALVSSCSGHHHIGGGLRNSIINYI